MRIHNTIIALLLLLPVTGGYVYADAMDEQFREATLKYSNAEYEEAIGLLHGIEEQGYESPELLYNLGNAYFKQGRIGKSILYYERALILAPGDEEIIMNLQIAGARTRDKVEPIPLLFFVQWWNDVKTGYSADTFLTAAIAAAWLLAASVFVFFGFRNITLRRLALVSGNLFAVLLVVASLLWFSRSDAIESHRFAIVMPATSTLLSTPDASGIESLKVHEGLKVQIIEIRDDYYSIRLADGKTGWIHRDDVERI